MAYNSRELQITRVQFPQTLQNLIDSLKELPGVGPRMASRIALYLFKNRQNNFELVNAIEEINNLKFCEKCGVISDTALCDICSDPERESKLMVVEEHFDIMSMEEVHDYLGYYFVLGGLISPINSVMPENLRIEQLKTRLRELMGKKEVEIIFALNPSFEGETTINYLKSEMLEFLGHEKSSMVKFTRLGIGLPKGSDLDYADSETLKYALKLRGEV